MECDDFIIWKKFFLQIQPKIQVSASEQFIRADLFRFSRGGSGVLEVVLNSLAHGSDSALMSLDGLQSVQPVRVQVDERPVVRSRKQGQYTIDEGFLGAFDADVNSEGFDLHNDWVDDFFNSLHQCFEIDVVLENVVGHLISAFRS